MEQPRIEITHTPHRAWKLICEGEVNGLQFRVAHHATGEQVSVSLRARPEDAWAHYPFNTCSLVDRAFRAFLDDRAREARATAPNGHQTTEEAGHGR